MIGSFSVTVFHFRRSGSNLDISEGSTTEVTSYAGNFWLYLATIGKIETNKDNERSMMANGSNDRSDSIVAK